MNTPHDFVKIEKLIEESTLFEREEQLEKDNKDFFELAELLHKLSLSVEDLKPCDYVDYCLSKSMQPGARSPGC